MNATTSVAAGAPAVQSPGAAGAHGNAPGTAGACDAGGFAAMLDALSTFPGPDAASADVGLAAGEAAPGEDAEASEAAGEHGAGALPQGWPWLGLAAAATLPAAGTSATPSGAAGGLASGSAELSGAGSRTGKAALAGGPASAASAASAAQGAQAAGAALLPQRDDRGAPGPASGLPPFAATASAAESLRPPATATPADGAAPLPPGIALVASTHHVAPQAPVHEAALPSRPGEPSFASDLAAEVRVMVEGDLQQAELSLHPAELGPIQVQLRMNGGSAEISFAAANGFTRDGIAQALPQLREMLASQGLSLGQAGVDSGQRDHRAFDGSPQASPSGGARQGGGGSGGGAAIAAAPAVRVGARSLLDLYA